MQQQDDYRNDYLLSMPKFLKKTNFSNENFLKKIQKPFIFRKSIDACSWIPIPVRIKRNDESFPLPEHVIN
jgi:hypothetical protein